MGVDVLIERFCPQGVEHRPLGEIARLVRGNGMPKSVLIDDGVGAIHYGQIYTKYGAWTESTISFVTAETAAKLAKADPGDVIVTNTSENFEDVGKAVAWLGAQQIVTGGHATIIKHDLEPKYLSYWFQSPSFASQKRTLATGTKVIDVSARKLERIEVPVPPLEVQQEIVRILDAFAELEAELEAELDCRCAQYRHYRDLLFARWQADNRPLGEVGDFQRGRRFTKKDVVPDGIPSIHYGEIYTHYGVSAISARCQVRESLRGSLRFAQRGDVVIAGVGETVADVGKAVAWLGAEPVAVHDDTFRFRSDLNPKFVAYALQTEDFHSQKNSHVARAKVKRLSVAGLSKITIPVPSRPEQDAIVMALDAFDALVSDLSIGLPAELAARRKQYEYYRNRLLTFKELEV